MPGGPRPHSPLLAGDPGRARGSHPGRGGGRKNWSQGGQPLKDHWALPSQRHCCPWKGPALGDAPWPGSAAEPRDGARIPGLQSGEQHLSSLQRVPPGPCSPPALGLQGKSFSLPFPPLKCSTQLGVTSSRMSACFLCESSVVSGLEPVTCGPATTQSDLEGTGGQWASRLPVSPPLPREVGRRPRQQRLESCFSFPLT